MIEFKRTKNKVYVLVDSGTGVLRPISHFERTYDDEDEAEVMMRRYDEQLFDALQAIRQDAYDQGWKDAKAKRGKRTWFRGLFE